jgi:hypothetical protein
MNSQGVLVESVDLYIVEDGRDYAWEREMACSGPHPELR